MKVLKYDEKKHEIIAEDTRGYRFRVTINRDGMPEIEECEEYNRSVLLSKRR